MELDQRQWLRERDCIAKLTLARNARRSQGPQNIDDLQRALARGLWAVFSACGFKRLVCWYSVKLKRPRHSLHQQEGDVRQSPRVSET